MTGDRGIGTGVGEALGVGVGVGVGVGSEYIVVCNSDSS